VVNGNNLETSTSVSGPDDVICSCSPTSATVSPASNSNSSNNPTPTSPSPHSNSSSKHHHHHSHHHSHQINNNQSQNRQFSPYLVSAATSPRKKHTKIVMTASGLHETTKTLPPLDINRTILHHHSTRRSARKSSRGHTVPVMQLGAASKRSHSAASTNQDEAAAGGNIIVPGTPDHSTSVSGRRSRQSPERKSSKVNLYTPEKMSRRGHHHILNKIETVRILRARPAFYPIKLKPDLYSDKVTITSSTSNKSSARSMRDYAALVDVGAASVTGGSTGVTPGASLPPTGGMMTHQDYMELPHNILGKHITLRMDRSEMKRKRGRGLASLPPSTNLT
jgi:hypothetical protein